MSSSTNANESLEKSSIAEFYEGTNVLITGATGFLGKALLEKLLRSCSGIRCIYVLIRPKKEKDIITRLRELLESPVFENLKENIPECFRKVKVVSGDIAEQGLGLGETDSKLLTDEINVVFHTAATVKFTEDLKDAVLLNVVGTKRVAEFCKEAMQLKSFIYVSTAYSNPDKKDVDEIVYGLPYDPTAVINSIRIVPQDILRQNTKKLIGKHPNTYTFSKALAESVVLEYSSHFPAAIVRPSIVSASWKEPFPGWVDSLGAATGLIVQGCLGAIRYFKIKNELYANFIPVDVVVNTIIAAAWHSTAHRSDKIKVYNCVSSQINGLTWGRFGGLTLKYSREYPTRHLIGYPTYHAETNEIVYGICNALFNFTPALVYDIILCCTGKTPKMVRLWKKTTEHFKIVEFGTCQERFFRTTTFRSLMEAVRKAEDGAEFDIDISCDNGFDWDDYMKKYVLGIRKYIFKEDLSNFQLAKARIRRFYWLEKLIQSACILGFVAATIIHFW